MEKTSIFEFRDYQTYLQFVRSYVLSKRNRSITLEKWASRLGYRSPRSVAMVLKGQRLPSESMVSKLSKDLEFNRREKLFFSLLVKLEKSKRKNLDLREIYEEIDELNPVLQKASVDSATFFYIAEWQHFVLRQLLGLKESSQEIESITKALRKKLNLSQVRSAIELMAGLKLIHKVNGRWSIGDSGLITSSDIPSKALQLHHEQMLSRAIESISEQAVSEREITSVTLGFDRKRIGEAKEMIRKFRDSFDKKFSTTETDQVYQFNIQFFSHTEATEGKSK